MVYCQKMKTSNVCIENESKEEYRAERIWDGTIAGTCCIWISWGCICSWLTAIINELLVHESIVNVVSEPLISIIMPSAITINCLFYNSFYSLHQLFVSCSFMKSPSQSLPIKFQKAFHIFTLIHHLNSLQNLSLVISDKFQGEEEKMLKMQKNIRLCSFHQLKVIFC